MAQIASSSSLPRLTDPSLSTAATWIPGEKRIIFASEWYFKPQGIEVVKRRFEKELEKVKLTARHEWKNDDQTFRIRCIRTNAYKIWPIFHAVLQGVIREEGGEDWWSDDESDLGDSLSDAFDGGRPLAHRKIERLAFWRKKHGINDEDNEDDGDDESRRRHQVDVQFPVEIKFFKEKFAWFCTNSTINLDSIVSDRTLVTLSKLTGCQFKKSLTDQAIYIGGDAVERGHLAISKLDNIRKYSEPRPFYQNNIFYTEKVENFRVSVRNFPRIKRRFFETTLIDNLQWIPYNCYDNLFDSFTIRCHVFNHLRGAYEPFKMEKAEPAVPNMDDKKLGFRDWIGFNYCSKGEASEDPILSVQIQEQTSVPKQTENPVVPSSVAHPVQSTLLVSTKNAAVERWVKQIPKIESESQAPLSDDGSKESNGSSGGDRKESTKVSENSRPAWDTYVSYGAEVHDKVKQSGTVNVSSRLVQNIATLRTPAQSVIASIRPAVAKVGIPSQMDGVTKSAWPALTPSKKSPNPKAVAPSPPKQAAPASKDVNSIGPHPKQESDDLLTFLNHERENRSLLDDNISTLGSIFEVLEPVRKSSAPTPLSVQQCMTTPRSISAVHVSSPASRGNSSAVFNPPALTAESEVQQKSSEVSTRKFHYTMNQKAPKPSNKALKSIPKGIKSNAYAGRLELPSPSKPQPRRSAGSEVPHVETPVTAVDPLPQFRQEINSGFDEMMKGIRGFRGQVVVQAELGRFILKRIGRRYLSLKEDESSEDPETIQNVLQNGPFTFFTNIVTIIPAEIHYLIDMKDSAGAEMWEKSPSSWTVLYEFLCRDMQSLTEYGSYNPFMVDIDAETFVAQVKQRHHFGTINVHGTKRHWDFRLAAFGLESNESTEGLYGDFATALQLSLYIPPGLSKPLVTFEVPTSFSRFQIFGVRVRRTTEYSSKDRKSTLKVHEVRELRIELHDSKKEGVKIWKATASPVPREGKDRLDFWHEVSISSNKADELFEQNKKLELGDEASWTPESLSKVDAAQAMYLPACEMIKKMDGVGYWNENGVDVKKAMSTITASSTRPPPQMVFW